LRELLVSQRLLALGVVVDTEPVVGLVPYAISADFASLFVQASRLARHSQGLKDGGRWSGTIHEPDAPAKDPLQIPRVVLEGTVDVLAGAQPDFQPAARAFLARFPGAAMTLALPDFTLYRLNAADSYSDSGTPSTCRRRCCTISRPREVEPIIRAQVVRPRKRRPAHGGRRWEGR
jgi:putative heme iron utilization protein